MSDWIDVSVPLRTGMAHWPGDLPVTLERATSIENGDVANLSTISMSVHSGTHMDAPLHFVNQGMSIDQMPLDATIGPARVVVIDGDVVDAKSLVPHDLQAGERVMLKTWNSARNWPACRLFLKQFVHINLSGAEYLVQRKVRTVGIDYLSVGGYQADGVETHQILLKAGIWAIEGLDLAAVEPGRYEMIGLPIKLLGSDGAPARVILRSAG